MFGIGLSELLVIFCVVIIFVRPKDLPRLFRRIGKAYGVVKKSYDELMAARDRIVRDIEDAADAGEEEKKPPDEGDAADADTRQP